jgi:predicted nuclease with TOPRIM domain
VIDHAIFEWARERSSSRDLGTRYNPAMSEGERSIALTTACDDLQAQLEAGDRNVRHIDHDLTMLRDALRVTVVHTETLADLQRHIGDLRANLREQRFALREVRRAATTLCATVAQTREEMESLADESKRLPLMHQGALNESARLHETPRDLAGDHTVAQQADGPLTDARRITMGLPTNETSDLDRKV